MRSTLHGEYGEGGEIFSKLNDIFVIDKMMGTEKKNKDVGTDERQLKKIGMIMKNREEKRAKERSREEDIYIYM